MNHSCDPNCIVEKWSVGKETRMAFVTKKPVSAGEELTFDYQWEMLGADSSIIKCCCGSANCHGFVDYVPHKAGFTSAEFDPGRGSDTSE